MDAIDMIVSASDGAVVWLLLFGLCTISVFLLFIGSQRLFAARTLARRRLAIEAVAGGGRSAPDLGPSLRADHERSPLSRMLARWGLRMASDSKSNVELRRRLIRAGFSRPTAVGIFHATRVVLAFSLPIVAILLAPIVASDAVAKKLPMLLGALGLLGFFLPTIIVGRIIAKRQAIARTGFPDALDTLLVCVEAGLGLDAAINRVAVEIGIAYPMLGEQFTLVAAELRTGQSRETALRNLATRLNIDEASSLATLLVQSEHLGTSVAQTLRVLADDFRQKRMLSAEERANVLPVKLAFPLVLFILPALMVVIMGPTMIRILHTLMPTMGGHG